MVPKTDTSRGGGVNTAEMIAGTENGHIGCYRADICENERAMMPCSKTCLYDWKING